MACASTESATRCAGESRTCEQMGGSYIPPRVQRPGDKYAGEQERRATTGASEEPIRGASGHAGAWKLAAGVHHGGGASLRSVLDAHKRDFRILSYPTQLSISIRSHLLQLSIRIEPQRCHYREWEWSHLRIIVIFPVHDLWRIDPPQKL